MYTIYDNDRFVTSDKGDLTIRNATQADSGKYIATDPDKNRTLTTVSLQVDPGTGKTCRILFHSNVLLYFQSLCHSFEEKAIHSDHFHRSILRSIHVTKT